MVLVKREVFLKLVKGTTFLDPKILEHAPRAIVREEEKNQIFKKYLDFEKWRIF